MSTTTFAGLSAELRQVLADVEEALKKAAADAGDHLDSAEHHASLRRACDHLRAAQREIRERAHSLDGMVRDNPWRAIVATGAVAFLVGFMVRRR